MEWAGLESKEEPASLNTGVQVQVTHGRLDQEDAGNPKGSCRQGGENERKAVQLV